MTVGTQMAQLKLRQPTPPIVDVARLQQHGTTLRHNDFLENRNQNTAPISTATHTPPQENQQAGAFWDCCRLNTPVSGRRPETGRVRVRCPAAVKKAFYAKCQANGLKPQSVLCRLVEYYISGKLPKHTGPKIQARQNGVPPVRLSFSMKDGKKDALLNKCRENNTTIQDALLVWIYRYIAD